MLGAASTPAMGGLMLPAIKGTVSVQGGGTAPGVSIKLFEDDGDGMFDPMVDTQVGSDVMTDGMGMYMFENLNAGAKYFVQRPAQVFGMTALPADISGLLDPGTPNLIIDAFQNNQGVKADAFTPISTSTLNDPMAGVLGNERDMYVRLVSGVGEVELRSNAFGVAVLQYDNTSGVVGHGIITWDGVDMSASPTPSLGLGNVDLTQGGLNEGLLFMLGIDATGAGDKARIRIFNDDASVYSEAMVTIPVTDGTATAHAFLSFDDFVGSVSPTNVNAIQLILGEGAKSVDAQIDFIGAIGPKMQDFEIVPEPSSLVLGLLGLCSLLGLRRRG
jgi:hypothetical protein